jgi:hypothetical protein
VKIALLFKNVYIFWALWCKVVKRSKAASYYIVECHSVASRANISSTRLTLLSLPRNSGPRSVRVPIRISVAIRCVPLACNAA